MKHYLKATVCPGMFTTERAVTVETGTRTINMLVDETLVSSDMVEVWPVYRDGDETLVDLPGTPFAGPSRATVRTDDIVTI